MFVQVWLLLFMCCIFLAAAYSFVYLVAVRR